MMSNFSNVQLYTILVLLRYPQIYFNYTNIHNNIHNNYTNIHNLIGNYQKGENSNAIMPISIAITIQRKNPTFIIIMYFKMKQY